MERKSDVPYGPFSKFSLIRCASFLKVKYKAVEDMAKANIDVHSEKFMSTLLDKTGVNVLSFQLAVTC